MTVRLPRGKTLADGPFPTLIEYSGYQVAAPHDLLGSVLKQLTGESAEPDPLAPALGTAVGSLIAPMLDFAVVSVQMRGSGCSGGAFDLFDLPTTYDGYDAVETVAAQKWVKGGKVGMAGISFSGITQLFVAGTRPPHLAAIAPMSVTDDLYTGTGYPGRHPQLGLRPELAAGADGRRAGRRPGVASRTRARSCKDGRQALPGQPASEAADPERAADPARQPFRTPSLYAPALARRAGWRARACRCSSSGSSRTSRRAGTSPRRSRAERQAERLDLAPERRARRLARPEHDHALGRVPQALRRERDPADPDERHRAERRALPLPRRRRRGAGRAVALRSFTERRGGQGGVPAGPARAAADGQRRRAGRAGLDRRDMGARLQRLAAARGARHALLPRARTARSARSRPTAGSASYVADPGARPRRRCPATATPTPGRRSRPTTGRRSPPARASAGCHAPLARDVVIAGPSSLDLQLRSSARDTDLQVTLSEVRPDGDETYVQNGWLRASHRKLDPRRSTALDPVPTHLGSDAAPLPRGRFTLVRVPICPVAHAFRAGSRIRVTVEAPGGDRPRWALRHRRHGPHAQHDRARRPLRIAARPPGRGGRDRPGNAAAARRPRCAASRAGATPPPPTAAEPTRPIHELQH